MAGKTNKLELERLFEVSVMSFFFTRCHSCNCWVCSLSNYVFYSLILQHFYE